MTLIYSSIKKIETQNNKGDFEDKNIGLYNGNSEISSENDYLCSKQVENLIYCSGQIGINPEVNTLVDGGIEKEAIQACRNIKTIIGRHGVGLKDVIKVTIFLKNMRDLKIVEGVYKNYFLLKPPRTIIEVSDLEQDAYISIEVIAYKNSK